MPLVEFTFHTAATKLDIEPAPERRAPRHRALRRRDANYGRAQPLYIGRALVAVNTEKWSQQVMTTEQDRGGRGTGLRQGLAPAHARYAHGIRPCAK